MERIELTSLGQISEADITFGDLTVFVGEQASGKSILLQLMKLILDAGDITRTLKKHGFDWHGKIEHFLSLYFGEGMDSIWDPATTKITVDDAAFEIDKVLTRKGKQKSESLCLIPAQRVMALKDGWPRAFTDYAIGDPYTVKQFSEQLRLLLEMNLSADGGLIFPQVGRMNKTIREAIGKSILGGAQVKIDCSRLRKRIVLDVAGSQLPFMVWSTGQREFILLLMGLYRLMPSGGARKKNNRNWIVIEEPEMGLYPKGITALLIVLLDLLKRGYKIIISTHSAQILNFIWALQLLIEWDAGPAPLLKLLDVNATPFSKGLAEVVLEKKRFKSYYISGDDSVKDISTLDPEDPDDTVADFGGLTAFSTKVSEVLSGAIWREEI